MQSNVLLQHSAPLVSARPCANRGSMWHTGTEHAISTVGTGFKPYCQRLKEKLL